MKSLPPFPPDLGLSLFPLLKFWEAQDFFTWKPNKEARVGMRIALIAVLSFSMKKQLDHLLEVHQASVATISMVSSAHAVHLFVASVAILGKEIPLSEQKGKKFIHWAEESITLSAFAITVLSLPLPNGLKEWGAPLLFQAFCWTNKWLTFEINPPQRSDSSSEKLPSFMTDLTASYREKEEPLCLGREKEKNQLKIILGKTGLKNPLLLGEAGCGKSTIARHFAWQVANQKIEAFKEYKVLELSVTGLLAKTELRGKVEEKLQELFTLLRKGKVILFVDEIHKLMGAGSSMGHTSGSAENYLKPILELPDIRLIGATTLQDHNKHMKDSAFNRRFSEINIPPLSAQEIKEVLRGYEAFFKKSYGPWVSLPKEVINLLTDQKLEKLLALHGGASPSWQIDLLDTIGAEKAFNKDHTPFSVQEIEAQLNQRTETLRRLHEHKQHH